MNHLIKSFQTHIGSRGVHFYDTKMCNFLQWDEVVQFLKTFPVNMEPDKFADSLLDTLSNYNPNTEYLAVHQVGSTVSVELYADPDIHA